MTRYSPTLFVGLGGSGVAVARWLRQIVGSDASAKGLAFRGIDFDLSNGGGGPLGPLGSGEFRFFEPSAIAECVRTINNNVVLPDTHPQKKAHDLIRKWYPDTEGEVIRYAQAEAAGARQWRALGRIGFFLNDRDILDEVDRGLTEIAGNGSKAERVVLVSSMSGGTGSGILIDVAASIRAKHPELPVHAVLLLPEFFDHVDFRSKIVANAYAMLWELAELANRREFTATYPTLPEINWRTTTAPLTRIYLLGPYVGDRRPFLMPDEGYANIAELLLVLSDAELRSNARSYQANSDGAAVGRNDPYARYVFSSLAAATIRIICYGDLGCLVGKALAVEAASADKVRPVFDLLTGRPSTDERDAIVKLVEAFAQEEPPTLDQLKTDIKAAVKKIFERAEPTHWTAETLKKFMEEVRRCVEEFPDDALAAQLVKEAIQGNAVSHGPLAAPCRKLEAALAEPLAKLTKQLGKHPHALANELESLRQRIQRQAHARQPEKIPLLDDFDQWLDAKALSNAILGKPLLRMVRRRKLEEHVTRELSKRFETHGRELISKIVFAYAAERLRRAIADARGEWDNLTKLEKETAEAVEKKIGMDDERRMQQRASLGPADVDVRRVLDAELSRLPDDVARTKLKNAILDAFQRAAKDYTDDHGSAAELLQAMEETMDALRAGSGGLKFDCLSPDVVYGPETVDRTLLSCVTPVFRPGRIDGLISQRTARLVIPKRFRDYAAFEQRIKDSCRGLLGAGVQQISERDGDRMFVLVENLFHPADDIAHVDSYWNDYRRRSNRELFHIDKSFAESSSPLLASGRTGKVLCGNLGCSRDIRSVDREEWICPFCARPIRNRCGNPRCGLDDLSQHADLDDIIRSDKCPECRERLVTYWWECPRHRQRVPMDKPHCPLCVREGWPPEKRPQSLDRFVCPACSNRGVKEPYVATGGVARACRLGVNGHDESRALRELGNALTQRERCPKCGTHLVPYCPWPADAERHFLHRPKESDRWRCMTHPKENFYTCFGCKFAVTAADKYCPRCGLALADCRYCTPHRYIIIPAKPPGERCPNCGISRASSSLRPDPLDLFCTNIFQCYAAETLGSASMPRGTETCPFCASRALIPQFLRDQTINDCPLCRLVFTPSRFPEKHAMPTSGLCPLCGLGFAEASEVKSDRGKLAAMLAIMRALVFFKDPDETLSAIHRGLLPEWRRSIPALLRDFLVRVQSPEIRQLLTVRIDRLNAEYIGFMRSDRSETPGTNAADSGHKTPPAAKTIADLTEPGHVLNLREDQIDDWLQELRDLGTNSDQLESYLGAGLAYLPPEDSERYEARRRMFRDRFKERWADL